MKIEGVRPSRRAGFGHRLVVYLTVLALVTLTSGVSLASALGTSGDSGGAATQELITGAKDPVGSPPADTPPATEREPAERTPPQSEPPVDPPAMPPGDPVAEPPAKAPAEPVAVPPRAPALPATPTVAPAPERERESDKPVEAELPD